MIRSERAHLNVVALSHPGMKGKNNEDRYTVLSHRVSAQQPIPSVFAVIADGIGGHRAGEVAAELAVNHISQVVSESDAGAPLEILARAIHTASDAIAAHAVANSEQIGMGATCACVWIINDRLYTAHVGDSRIYLVRGGRIHQLTTDHTWIQEALDRGILAPEQARDHPNVHVIRRYLGSPQPPRVDFRLRLDAREEDAQAEANQSLPLRPGDLLLLSSDGLTDLVWNDEILEIIRSRGNLKDTARALIDLANRRGGHDNITIILISAPREWKRRDRQRDVLTWLIAGGIGLTLLFGVAAALAWYFLQPLVVPTPTVSPTLTATASMTASPTATATATRRPPPTVTPSPFPTQTPTLELPIILPETLKGTPTPNP